MDRYDADAARVGSTIVLVDCGGALVMRMSSDVDLAARPRDVWRGVVDPREVIELQ